MMFELVDPVDIFLNSVGVGGHADQDIECTVQRNVSEDRNTVDEGVVSTCSPSLLWRKDKEASFSDWTIVLIVDDSVELKTNNRSDRRLKKGVETRGDKRKQLETVFHVHRNILSSVSVYFKVQFEQHVLIEGINSTSNINLPTKAIDAFPCFLDYLYSPEFGRLGFRRENAVALRHLSIYFGTDRLLEEITKLILEDMKTTAAGKLHFDTCVVFNDFKLMEAIKMQKIQQKVVLEMASDIFKTIDSGQYMSDLLSAWKKIMRHLDMQTDIFSALQNSIKYPDILIEGAGIPEANGVYKLVKKYDEGDSIQYCNGICILYKSTIKNKWCISLGYFDHDKEQWQLDVWYRTSYDQMDSDWYATCDETHPPPQTMVILNSKYTVHSHIARV